jgi:ABC-type nitrate/sulfonate/bicarbonate transport system permease component
MSMNRIFTLRLGTIVLFLAIWELVGRSGLVQGEVLPPASEVFAQLIGVLGSDYLAGDIRASLYEIGVGFVVGSILGLSFGAVMGVNNYLYKLFEPLIYYMGAVPKIILFPILILFLSTGLQSKAGMAAITAFFPIVINTALAVREVKPIYVRAARSLGANRTQLYTKVYVPSILGPVLSGMRLGLGVAITGALLAETAVAQEGLGFRAIELYSQLRIAEMYGLLLLIFIVASLLNVGIGWVIRRTTHYQQQEASGTTSVT